jgi:hypothetical protein
MLKCAAFALAVLLSGIPGAAQKKGKPPEIVVLEAKARRAEGRIQIDARVRAAAEKPLRGLIVYFDLLSPENGVLTTVNEMLEEGPLAAKQERSCESATSEHVRAVRFRVRASDRGDRELRVANDGPFPIE